MIDYIHPLSSGVMLLKHLLCERMNFPCPMVDGAPPPKIFRKQCCFGSTCQGCKSFHRSSMCILNCPKLFHERHRYNWKEYGKVLLDNGKANREIKEFSGGLAEFRNAFFLSFGKYKEHYFKFKWLNLCRRVDLESMGPNTLLIQTDYSAQPVLDSQDKLNCVGHGVCVLSCWVVIHSPREEYFMNDGKKCYYTFYECDHIRVVTPSTGKQKDQDWFLHCEIFEELIKEYKIVLPELNKIIVWTDGAPNQYKCRQNFFWLTTVQNKFDISIVHRFGATAQFKGVHDKIGQVA